MRIVFMGTPEFAVAPLAALIELHDVALVVTQPDRPAGRGRELAAPPVKELALSMGVPVIQPRSARMPEFVSALRQTGAELGVVVAYGKILPGDVLEAFPRGCINVHASLLPRYRGAAPIQWSIICGETRTGVTIMRLDEGMDTGPILLQKAMDIEPDDTAGTLFERMAPLGVEALLEAISGLEQGTLVEVAQDHDAATYAPLLDKDEGVVDWTRDAAVVCNLIRGVDPWPGAETTLSGQRLRLFGATLVERQGRHGMPGEVLDVDDEGLRVACGQGIVAVTMLQAPGKRPMLARLFAMGRPIAKKTLLGQPAPARAGARVPEGDGSTNP